MITLKRQRGYLLITVIVTLFLLASIAVLLAHDSANSANTSNRELESARAGYVASAGMQHALWRAQNNACMGDVTISSTSLGADSYTATIAGAATGTAYMLAADQDAWIRSDDVTRNNGTGGSNHIRQESGNVEQVLTRFDLSTIPTNSQINSAIAWFHLKALQSHPEGAIDVYRITTDWEENSVTWESFVDGYAAERIAMLPPQESGDVWVAINITGQVQSWVNGQPNYGLLFDTDAEGIHTEYTSRDDGTNPPRLEVVVGSGPASPVNIDVTGTLATGVTRELAQPAAAAYQPPVIYSFSPGPAESADAEIWDQQPSKNYGNAEETWVSSASNDTTRSLLRFSIGEVPDGARILDAKLSLKRQSGSGADQPVSAHRITNSWSEDSVTWNSRESGTDWDSAGGDFDKEAVATTAVGPANDRYSWDITPLLQGWVDGSYSNHGVMLVAGMDGMPGERFRTSDYSVLTQRPSLSVTYACECGSACMAPQGSGKLVMVIGNSPANPSDSDRKLRDRFESWGYTVSFIQDDDSQGNYSLAASDNDAVFVAKSVNPNNVGTKLAGVGAGVVSQIASLNDELGISADKALVVGRQITLTDTSHYITSVFQAGALEIYDGNMLLRTTAGTEAPQRLADFGGAGALVAVPKGGALVGGGTAAGPRVMLPVGGDVDVNLSHVNNNGWLIVQRSLSWAMGAGDISIGKILLVVGDASNPASLDADRRTLIESWGYTVTLIDDSASQASFDSALSASDAAYVSGSVSATALGTKLTAATTGIVSEEEALILELGFGDDTGSESRDEIDILDNTHPITSGFALGMATIVTSPQPLILVNNGTAPGVDALAQIQQVASFYEPSLVTLEEGSQLFGGGVAPGRRVSLPWGDSGFNINSLNDNGKAIMQRAIEWAAGAGVKLGLIAHWKLDEGTGVDAVDSVGGHDGTLDFGPVWSDGALGGGVEFSDDYHAITAPYSESLAITGDMTLATWVYANELLPNRVLLHKGPTNVDHNFYLGLSNSTIQFAMSPPGGGWNTVDSGPTSIAANQWHHIAVSFDDSEDTVIFYVDGVPIAKAEETVSPSDFGGAVRLGRNSNSYGWRGKLDDVRIYRDVLDADEVAALAERPPIAHWKFDETSGSTAVDSAGGHDGVMAFGSWTSSGIIDGALDLPGNAYVRVAHDDALILNNHFTLSAWATASPAIGYHTIINKGTSGNNQDYWFGVWGNWLTLGFYTNGGFKYVEVEMDDWIPSQPTHFAASFDNATDAVKLYKNGVLLQTGTMIHEPAAGSEDLIIGRSQLSEFWNGMLDDVRIYDRALADDDIAALAAEADTGGGGGSGGDGGDGVLFEGYSDAAEDENESELELDLPAGTVAGDLLIAALATDGDSGDSFDAPSGWTEISAGDANGRVSLGVWWKIASSSEDSEVSLGWSGAEEAYGWIMRFTGHDPDSPIFFDNGMLTGTGSNTPIAQKINTPEDNMMVLRIGGFDDDDINVGNPGLSGHTAITMGKSGTGKNSVSGGAGYFIQQTAGDTGFGYFALTKREEFRDVSLAIRPAP